MRRLAGLTLLLALAGCGGRNEPPVQTITPGARVIYNGGVPVWVTCDRGNLVYMSAGTPVVAVVPNGCPNGSP